MIGGQGCLGNRLVSTLVQDGGYTVYSLDLYIPPENRRVPGVHAYIQTDITKKNDVVKAMNGIEAVFMTASLQPSVAVSNEIMQRVNIGGAQNVLEACKEQKVKRLIYTSSVSVTMGKNPKRPHDLIEESQPFPEVPLNMYVESKGRAEIMIRKANNSDGLKTCALRLAGLMGGKNNGHLSLMMAKVGPLVFYVYPGDCSIKIDYMDTDAAVEPHIIAEKKLHREQDEENLYKSLLVSSGIEKNGTISGAQSESPRQSIGGKAYNITMRDKCTVKEFVEFIAKERSVPRTLSVPMFVLKPIAYVNRWLYILTGLVLTPFSSMHADFVMSFNFLPNLASKELGWSYEKSWKDIARKALSEY